MPVGASFPGGAVIASKLWAIGGGDPLLEVLSTTPKYLARTEQLVQRPEHKCGAVIR